MLPTCKADLLVSLCRVVLYSAYQALLYCDHLVPAGASNLAMAYAALYRRCILQQQSIVASVVKEELEHFMTLLTALTDPLGAATLKELLTNVVAAEHGACFFSHYKV